MPAYACGARVRALIVAFLATWLLILAYVGTANAADEPGRIRFAMGAESDFDRFSYSPSNDRQSWMREHYWRMRTYSPYFDSRLDWYPNAWNYKDAYAIYTGEALARERPEWILRDQSGNKLYVQFGCSNGSCPQYAGDIGNPAFRAHWIADMRSRLAQGYRGLFVDDVNMELKVSDGNGRQVRPRDPRTGETMSDGTWQRYMADFMVEIRAAFPEQGDRPQRPLVRRRRKREPPPAAERRGLHRDRARRQRRRAHRRHRPVRRRVADALRRAPARARHAGSSSSPTRRAPPSAPTTSRRTS